MCRVQTFYYEVCGCIHYRRTEKCQNALHPNPDNKAKGWQGVWCKDKIAQLGKPWTKKNDITCIDEKCPKCIIKSGPEDPEQKAGEDKKKRLTKAERIEAVKKRADYREKTKKRRREAWEKTWESMKKKHAAEKAEKGGDGEKGDGTDVMDDGYEQAIRRSVLGTKRPVGKF